MREFYTGPFYYVNTTLVINCALVCSIIYRKMAIYKLRFHHIHG
jgi:hypothetical protein